MHVFQTQVYTPNSEPRLARQIKASKLESAWRGADSGGGLPAWQMCLMQALAIRKICTRTDASID